MSAKRMLRIESVMHPFPHTIGLEQSLEVAKEMMKEHNIRHLPVQSRGEVVGVLSERDLYFCLAVDQKQAAEVKVGDAYTEEPYIVDLSEPLAKVARRMSHDHIGCALVQQANGNLCGIFTTVDACRALAEVLSEQLDQ